MLHSNCVHKYIYFVKIKFGNSILSLLAVVGVKGGDYYNVFVAHIIYLIVKDLWSMSFFLQKDQPDYIWPFGRILQRITEFLSNLKLDGRLQLWILIFVVGMGVGEEGSSLYTCIHLFMYKANVVTFNP